MAETPTHDCPRCGYDLSAEVSKWLDECPLEGACWECGLRVQWRDVLVAERRFDLGLVEHSPNRVPLGAAWRTWCLTLHPQSFWARVRLEHRVVVTRLFLWLLLVLGSAYLIIVPLRLLCFEIDMGFTQNPLATGTLSIPWINILLAPCLGVLRSWDDGQLRFYLPNADTPFVLPRSYTPMLAATILYPIMILAMPETRERAKVRWSHVLRAWALSNGWFVAVLAAWVVLAAFPPMVDWALPGSPRLAIWISWHGSQALEWLLALGCAAWLARY